MKRTKQDFLRAGAGAKTDYEVAEVLGVTHQAVSAFRRKHGISSVTDRSEVTRSAAFRRAQELSAEGLSVTEIAATLDIHYQTLMRAEREAGIKLPRYQGNRDRKYTDSMILAAIRSSRTMAAAAIKLGMNQPGIYAAINNRGLDAKVSELLDAKGCRTFANGARYPANRKPNKK